MIAIDKRMDSEQNVELNATLQGERDDRSVAQLSICLLGLTFDSPNLGVQALLDGSIRSILSAFPESKVCVLDYGYEGFTRTMAFGDRNVSIHFVNLRFSKKLYLSSNVARLLLYAVLLKFVPQSIREYCVNRNPTLKRISEIHIAAAISGGDSFSDIYGLGRLVYEALPQMLILMMGKKLVLLPQTLGPFKGRIARQIAAYIMRRATVICSRDEIGMKATKQLLGDYQEEKATFCHDVGFVVKPLNPSTDELHQLQAFRRQGQRVIGLNISGLLYAGGYTRNNMFGLKVSYPEIVQQVLTLLVEEIKAKVVLVPHVYAEPTMKSIESDQAACEALYNKLPTLYRQNVVLLRGKYTANQIKYVIGTCDVFIGSRMHSCIAALSQGVPAVAISYSDKFDGVMRSIGMSKLIADPRCMTLPEMLSVISWALRHQGELREQLLAIMPDIERDVVSVIKRALIKCMDSEDVPLHV